MDLNGLSRHMVQPPKGVEPSFREYFRPLFILEEAD